MSCSNLSVSPLDIKTQHMQHNDRHSLVSRARRDVDESRDEVGASSTHIQLPRSSSHQVRKEQEHQGDMVIVAPVKPPQVLGAEQKFNLSKDLSNGT